MADNYKASPNRSSAQKVLLVFSILSIVFGALGLILGLLSFAGAAVVGSASSAQLADAGIATDDASLATGVIAIAGIVLLVSSVIGLVEGILGIRASNDNQKIMPVWYLAIIGLALQVISVISTIAQGSFNASSLISLAISAGYFYFANVIKQEAGK